MLLQPVDRLLEFWVRILLILSSFRITHGQNFAFSAKNGVVLACENKLPPLVAPSTVYKIEEVNKFTGMTYSGLGPDFRWENHF